MANGTTQVSWSKQTFQIKIQGKGTEAPQFQPSNESELPEKKSIKININK